VTGAFSFKVFFAWPPDGASAAILTVPVGGTSGAAERAIVAAGFSGGVAGTVAAATGAAGTGAAPAGGTKVLILIVCPDTGLALAGGVAGAAGAADGGGTAIVAVVAKLVPGAGSGFRPALGRSLTVVVRILLSAFSSSVGAAGSAAAKAASSETGAGGGASGGAVKDAGGGVTGAGWTAPGVGKGFKPALGRILIEVVRILLSAFSSSVGAAGSAAAAAGAALGTSGFNPDGAAGEANLMDGLAGGGGSGTGRGVGATEAPAASACSPAVSGDLVAGRRRTV